MSRPSPPRTTSLPGPPLISGVPPAACPGTCRGRCRRHRVRPVEDVVAGSAVDVLGAVAAVDAVVTRGAREPVVAGVAEESLLSAIDWAKRQSATLFELKAATDLAELLLKQYRMPEAYKHLSAALDRTPAGMVFPDHTRALQILSQLQSGTEAAVG